MVAPCVGKRGTALAQQGRRVVEFLGERPQWPHLTTVRAVAATAGPLSYDQEVPLCTQRQIEE